MGYTIDTSAVIAVLVNEASKPRILEITRDQELFAPPTLSWEVANAFSAMFKRRVADLDQARAALALFARIPIRLITPSLDRVVTLAKSLNVYAYDACMITCALESGQPLLTLDGGLKDLARRAGAMTVEVGP